MIKTMMAVAALALAAGNVQANSQQPKTGKLVVYRAGGIGFAVKEGFMLDGQPHNLAWNRRREFVLPAGQHTIAKAGLYTRAMDIQSVNVPAGSTIYFLYFAPFSLFVPIEVFELPSDQHEAARSAAKCSLQVTE